MGAVTVDDVLVLQMRRIPVKGGDVLHAMKCTDQGFSGFGEAYFSQVSSGAIKAWKRHLSMTLNLVVPIGDVKFVFVDSQGGLRVENIGESNYCRLTVPPGLWFGFQGRGEVQSLLLNIADIAHDPNEVERKALDEIEFDWMEIR